MDNILYSKAKKVQFLVIGRLQIRSGDVILFWVNILFLPTSEIFDMCIRGYWWLKRPYKSGKHSYHYVEKLSRFKTQHGRNPAILVAIVS